MKTTYQRLPAAEDRPLTAIIHQAPTSMGGGELARYAYTYTPSKQIATWQATQPGLPGREWSIAYDERQQVTAITEQPLAGPPASPQKVWRYQYDLSGNRIATQENNQTRTTSYNNLNQMTGINHGGSTWLRGHVDELANVTINGQNAGVYEDGTFESLTNVGPGAQTINVRATDTNGNTTTQNWQVNNGPASGAVPTHDLDGNLLTDGTYTYTWDARNRMTSVTKGSDTWTFQYDGQNRRINESKNGSLVRQFIWNGTRVMEERIEPLISGQGLLTRRYWTGGVEMAEAGIDPQANYCLHDHLGSLRVVVGDDGTNQIAAVASYDYSPWGQRSELTGTTNSPHSPGYTGHWWHESGLSLAVYRPYDPTSGRCPSRDPIQERGGLNLYQYSKNNSLNEVDPAGLASIAFNVTTAILKTDRPIVPAFALGVKTSHTVVVDDLDAIILSEHKFTGDTGYIGADSRLKVTARKAGPCFLVVEMTGWAQNNLNPFLSSIDYKVKFVVNTLTNKVRLTGAHDGYPSYTMSALSGAYAFAEIHYSRLNPPMEILVNESW